MAGTGRIAARGHEREGSDDEPSCRPGPPCRTSPAARAVMILAAIVLESSNRLPEVASARGQILFHARRERVAENRRKWQGRHMAKPPQSLAGGVFIAIAIFIGAIAGAISGQPSIGVLTGLGAGVLCAVLVWLRDRSRIGR